MNKIQDDVQDCQPACKGVFQLASFRPAALCLVGDWAGGCRRVLISPAPQCQTLCWELMMLSHQFFSAVQLDKYHNPLYK